MSWLFPSSGQSIGVSASVLPMNIQDWFHLGWTGWISLLSKGLSRIFSNITVQKHQFFSVQLCLWSNSHIHTRLLEKSYLWLDRPLSAKWCLCFFKTLSRFDIAVLPRSKCLLISWLQSPSALILEPNKMKYDTVSTFPPAICHEVIWLDTMIIVFWMLSFKSSFHSSLSLSSRGSF